MNNELLEYDFLIKMKYICIAITNFRIIVIIGNSGPLGYKTCFMLDTYEHVICARKLYCLYFKTYEDDKFHVQVS